MLDLPAVNAGGGYIIFGVLASEASIHHSDGKIPRHELYLLSDDITWFVADMTERSIECSPIQDQGRGLVVELKLSSGAPLHAYEPRHARPE